MGVDSGGSGMFTGEGELWEGRTVGKENWGKRRWEIGLSGAEQRRKKLERVRNCTKKRKVKKGKGQYIVL